MRLFFFILSLSIGIFSHAQNKQALIKSDSLFAKGVELYNQGNYKAAIPLFTESDKIDKAELDSTSNRRDYSAMWLGSCYYKLGDEEKAKEIDSTYYYLLPINRNITIKADSVKSIANNLKEQKQYKVALDKYQLTLQLQKEILGEEHYILWNTLANIAYCCYSLDEHENAIKYWHNSFKIMEKNSLQDKTEDGIILLKNLSYAYSEQKNYRSRKEVLLKAFNIYKNAQQKKFIEKKIDVLLDIADCCHNLEEYKEESSYIEKVLEKYKVYIGKNNEFKLYLLNYLANSKGIQDQPLKKESLLRECLDLIQKLDIEEKNRYLVHTLFSLLDISNRLGKYYQASVFCDTLLSTLKDTTDLTDFKEYIPTTLGTSAIIYSYIGHYVKCNKMGLLAVQKTKAIFGEKSYKYADILSGIGVAFYNLGDYKKALEYQTQSLSLFKELGHNQCLDYLSGICRTALLYSLQNNKAKATEAAIESWHLGQIIYNDIKQFNIPRLVEANLVLHKNGERGIEMTNWLLKLINDNINDNEEKALALLSVANMYYQLGKQAEAIDILEQRLKYIKKRSLLYAKYLITIAQYYQITSEYNKAIELGEEALDIQKEQCLEDSVFIAHTYSILAGIRYSKGEIDKALELKQSAINYLLDKQQNCDFSTVITFCNTLGIWYHKLGLYREAIDLNIRIIDVCKKTYGEESLAYARLIGNLGNNYGSIGDIQKAFEYTMRSVKIKEHISDMNSRESLTSIHNLACFYNKLGQHQKALNILLDVFNKQVTLGYDDDNSAMSSAHNISYVYECLEDYENAIRYEQKSLALLLQKHKRKQIMEYTHNLSYLIRYYYKSGNTNDVVACTKELFPLSSNIIRQNFSFLTSSERNAMWERMKPEIQLCIQNACLLRDSTLYSTAYDAALTYKGLLLNTDVEFHKLFEKENNKDLTSKFQKLNQIQKQLTSISDQENSLVIDSLKQKYYQLEKELIKSSKQFGDFTTHLTLTWKDVQNKLGKSDTAIEFINYTNAKSEICYAALVLKKGWAIPKIVNIASEKDIKQRSNNKQAIPYYSSDLGELIWKNIITEANIHEGDNILFAPIGIIYQIPIEYLSFKNDKYIHEIFNLKRLSTTKVLCYSNPTNQSQEAIVYGGLKYDADTSVLEAENKKYTDIPRDLNFQFTNNPDYLNLRNAAQYLPATKIEAEQIGQTLEKTKLKPVLYMDLKGTEESFKALSGKNINILHIATHGFYWTETEAKQTRNLDFLIMGDNNQSRYVEDKALTRSGLLLSGANITLKGKPLPEGLEDGILTAKELAGLDLRGLDLVVLSACQTGLGEITGDGVFGLQRGFKKAGANTLLMSLWKVDDTATQLLMTQFYKNLLAGKSKFESLRDAQKYVRDYEVEIDITTGKQWKSLARQEEEKNEEATPKEIRKIKKYKDPFYWAAFILLDAID